MTQIQISKQKKPKFRLLLFVCIVVYLMWTRWNISRWEGGLLISLGIIRWIMDFNEISMVDLLSSWFA